MHSVLVVDDDARVRDVLINLVDSFGYDVEAVCGSEEALDALNGRSADVALCDVNMPGRDGVWLAGQIREQYPHTAIIMATGVTSISRLDSMVRLQPASLRRYSSLVNLSIAPDGFCVSVSELPAIVNSY